MNTAFTAQAARAAVEHFHEKDAARKAVADEARIAQMTKAVNVLFELNLGGLSN